ncbi:MAG TPA: hypothetical protein VIK02_05155 [Candidatus Anoxymicrobiaceae bacterium]
MKTFKARRTLAIIFMLIAAAMLVGVTGCGGSKTSSLVEKAPTAEKATVESISTNPNAYDGKTIVTEGNYAVGYCAACFLLKDGVSSLRVEVSETVPLPPKSKLNSRMKVSGRIYVVKGSPNLIASNLEYE